MPGARQKPKLSVREQQLLTFASQGLTDTMIAHKLGISEATVGTYWGRVRIKLGPYSRTELVATMLKQEQEAAIEELKAESQRIVGQLQLQSSSGAKVSYHEVLYGAPDAMVIVSEDGIIDFVNEAAYELFGYTPGELNGVPMSKLIPHRFRDVHDIHRLEYLAEPKRRNMGSHIQTPALKRNGLEFPIRAALSFVPDTVGVFVICVIRPMPTI